MEPQAECILVILGATPEGKKEPVGFHVGVRESVQSWRELLVDIKARGLSVPPEIAVGDGAMGFWKELDEVFPGTRHQRCWVHKTANVLNKFPKSMQPTVKDDLREIWQAETRAAAAAAMSTFAEKYGAKYEKAVSCLTKDRKALLAFYDFPAEHWDHLRTGNPIESVFATVRHRTVRCHRRRRSSWCSSSSGPPRRHGAVCRARTSCQWSSRASHSPTVSPTTPKPAPLDRAASPKIAHSSQLGRGASSNSRSAGAFVLDQDIDQAARVRLQVLAGAARVAVNRLSLRRK